MSRAAETRKVLSAMGDLFHAGKGGARPNLSLNWYLGRFALALVPPISLWWALHNLHKTNVKYGDAEAQGILQNAKGGNDANMQQHSQSHS
eukprot:m.41216 g.41216  ORF g.41216 m.41216 type:complete len:91 (-) comp10527_c0_seq1:711-983(-)